MKKTLLGGLVGGIILFVWSFLAWVVLPLHTTTLHPIANEDAVVAALKPALPAKGVYPLRANPGMGADKATQDAWMAKMSQGPTGLIVYNPAGVDPMMAGQMGTGIVLDILSALVVSWLLTRSTAFSSPYMTRVMFCGVFAIFATVFDYLTMWNWMGYPGDFTSALIVDALIAWLLAGLGIAAIVKSTPA
jgi:hypothetical protein